MAHILLLLVLKAWSVLQNTEFLPLILWELSASLLIILWLCPVVCNCAWLCREDGKPHPELGQGLMVCVTKPLSTHGTQKHRAGLRQWGQQKNLQVSIVLLSRILEMERAARAHTRAERSFVVMLSSTKGCTAHPHLPHGEALCANHFPWKKEFNWADFTRAQQLAASFWLLTQATYLLKWKTCERSPYS